MSEISFYQLGRQNMERALLKLLQKTLVNGEKAIVRLGSDEEVSALDMALWTRDPDSFLPHGTQNSSTPEQQPIFLTAGEDNPANAEFLFLLDGASTTGLDDYKRVFLVFNGAIESEVKRARTHWKELSESGAKLTYWSQDDSGVWKKKSEV